MDPIDALDRAQTEFDRRLRTVTDTDWLKDSPCSEWNVRGVVHHVVFGNSMAVRLLAGASAAEARADLDPALTEQIATDAQSAFDTTAGEQAVAFRQPGALELTVHHPAMDMPGGQLLGFRTADLALHAWDVAQAIGGDVELDSDLVQYLWDFFQPMAPFIGEVGMFGTGPSGFFNDDAPLQLRLLDLTGRRS